VTPAQLYAMTRSDVHWTATPPTITVPGRKKGAGTLPRRKPISADALEAFRAFDVADCWGLTASKSSLWRTFTAARDRAIATLRIDRPDLDLSRATHMRPYDLRHSFAAFTYETTDDLHVTQELLDHADPRTTRRYAQGAVSKRLRDAGVAIADAFARRPRHVPAASKITH
jgi:integrase